MFGGSISLKNGVRSAAPRVEYLLGVARQKGIEIYLPPGCPLRIPTVPQVTLTDVLYGYDWQSPKAWWRKKRRRNKRRSSRTKI